MFEHILCLFTFKIMLCCELDSLPIQLSNSQMRYEVRLDEVLFKYRSKVENTDVLSMSNCLHCWNGASGYCYQRLSTSKYSLKSKNRLKNMF